MKVISWNCRGLGSKTKEEAMRALIKTENPDIMLVQETKLEENLFLQSRKRFWKKGGINAISARGASGGLGTLWNDSKYKMVAGKKNVHWLLTKFQHQDSMEVFSLFNVYVPVNAGEKKFCWDSLRDLADEGVLENIIIAGDLNISLSQSEKRGGCIVRDPAREWVEDLIQDWDLLDVKPSRGKYTWSNKRVGPGHIAARLDRFLLQSSYLLLGIDVKMKILSNSTSDHKPIMLVLTPQRNLGPIPFRFSPLWISQKDFLKKVEEIWRMSVTGSPFYVWEEKLRRVKSALKSWAKTIPSPEDERKQIQADLETHQVIMEEAEISSAILKREEELQQKLQNACRQEEEYWRQKSRSLWLKSGDRNTSYFHKQAQARRGYNSISEIKDGPQTYGDFPSIKKVAFNHFKILFNEVEVQGRSDKLLNEIPPKITARMNQKLEAKVTRKEIKDALFAMSPDKAPGPDGFTTNFIQYCWQIVKKDLHKMILKSQDCKKIGGSTNSTFLALIPKEKGAHSFNRFRPISLCNIGYKIISKVIANRLKGLLSDLIPENQGGFVQGRQIADNIILSPRSASLKSEEKRKRYDS
jgi:exonuclease III